MNVLALDRPPGAIPELVAASGEAVEERFWEFFAGGLRGACHISPGRAAAIAARTAEMGQRDDPPILYGLGKFPRSMSR